MMRRRDLLAALAALPPLGALTPAHASYRGMIEREPPPAPRPAINIIIDDIGNRLSEGRRSVNLPVTCSMLPHTSHVRELAEEAHALGRQMILHTPMQSIHGKNLGPGGLTMEMGHRELARTMRDNFAAVPYAQGVSNHMGSLLTRHPGHMEWVMEAVETHGAEFFVDSVTTSRSVAYRVAVEHGIPSSKRNVFLDHHRDPAHITGQFDRLVERARRRGTALGIGHPYPETLAVLEERMPRLEAMGIELVTTTRLIELQHERDHRWPA